jgi:hypothetical protein
MSGYCILYYGWLAGPPASPALRAAVEFNSNVAMVAFAVFALAAVATLVVFLWRAVRR